MVDGEEFARSLIMPKQQMAASLAISRTSRLCVHPFEPLSAPCGSHEWIRKALCSPRNLAAPELHDAHRVGRLAVLCQDEFEGIVANALAQKSLVAASKRTVSGQLYSGLQAQGYKTRSHSDPEQNTQAQINKVRLDPRIAKDVPVRSFIFDVETGLVLEVQSIARQTAAWKNLGLQDLSSKAQGSQKLLADK